MKPPGAVSFVTSHGREFFPALSAGPSGPVISFCHESCELTGIAYNAVTLCGRDGNPPPDGFAGMLILGGQEDESFDRATAERLIAYAAGLCDMTAWIAEAELRRRERRGGMNSTLRL